MKQSNIEFYSEAQEALKEAFERGYRLGRNDGREGVFMDIPSLVKQFGDSLPAALVINEKILHKQNTK